MEKILSIDVGYGDVKVYDGKGFYKFPTAVAPYTFSGVMGRRVNDSNSPYANEKVYTLEGRDYLVGKMALSDPNCKTSRSDNFIMKFTPLFVYKAMELTGVKPDVIALGIPLGRYISADSESFKKKYKERLEKFMVNREVVEVKNVEIFAQGHGIYIDCLMKEENQWLKDRNVVVVDIGFNTIDILSVIEGAPTRKNSTTLVNKGVVAVIKDLQEYIKNRYEIDLTEQATKDVLATRSVRIYGDAIDLSDVIDELIEDYAVWLIEEIEGRMKDVMQRADKMVIAGGGAYYVRNYIPEKYKNFVFVPDQPEYANTRGYYMLALRKISA